MVPNTFAFIGGASKSGTTSLYYYLKQHPELFLPEKKELHYFSLPELRNACSGPGDKYVADEIPESFEKYLQYYSGCSKTQICIDISPSYLTFPGAAARIYSEFPESKVIFILRNPADKAFSQYMHLRTECREYIPFDEALENEGHRRGLGYSDMWLYKESGFYADRLRNWITVFGDKNVRIYLFEDFIKDQADVLIDICNFLGVSSDFRFKEISVANRSGVPRSKLVSMIFLKPNAFTWLLRRIVPAKVGRIGRGLVRRLNLGAKVEFPEKVRADLLRTYEDDIRQVEAIIGRQTGWLRKPVKPEGE